MLDLAAISNQFNYYIKRITSNDYDNVEHCFSNQYHGYYILLIQDFFQLDYASCLYWTSGVPVHQYWWENNFSMLMENIRKEKVWIGQ